MPPESGTSDRPRPRVKPRFALSRRGQVLGAKCRGPSVDDHVGVDTFNLVPGVLFGPGLTTSVPSCCSTIGAWVCPTTRRSTPSDVTRRQRADRDRTVSIPPRRRPLLGAGLFRPPSLGDPQRESGDLGQLSADRRPVPSGERRELSPRRRRSQRQFPARVPPRPISVHWSDGSIAHRDQSRIRFQSRRRLGLTL